MKRKVKAEKMTHEWECSSKSNKHCESGPFSTPSFEEKPTIIQCLVSIQISLPLFYFFLKQASKTFYDENKKGNNIMLIVSII